MRICANCDKTIKLITNKNKDLYGNIYFCSEKCKQDINKEREKNKRSWLK